MSGPENGNWPSAKRGLPFRPPTVDEALPYSPFTSIVPFSSDVIPFPSAEPPTPPSTLTPEQRSTAKRSVQILNEEARASPVSPHLQHTLRKLQGFLDPDDLTQFRFKSTTSLSPSSSNSETATQPNATMSLKPTLSPFASMLLEGSEVSFIYPGHTAPTQPKQGRVSNGQPTPPSTSRATSNSQPVGTNGMVKVHPTSDTQRSSVQRNGTSAPLLRPGAAVVVKPLPGAVRPEEYRRFDAPEPSHPSEKKKQPADNGASALSAREREIADRNMADLSALLEELSEAGDTDCFQIIDTEDGELTVIRDDALAKLSDAVSRVVNLGCFSSVPIQQVLSIQSLCQPLIAATGQLSFDLELIDPEIIVERLASAQAGLRACKLVLQTMTEGCDDRQICSEDIIQCVVRLLKLVLNSCIIPVTESRRTGTLSALFALASQHRSDVYPLQRLCGNILSHIATLIGKVKLSESTLSPIESLSIDIIFAQNSDKEADSALGLQKFELFRQKAMDVLAQICAGNQEQRLSITAEILNNLERLPDKRASARHFKSAREQPIMLVSALFMRIIQAAAINTFPKGGSMLPNTSESDEDDGDAESDSESDYRSKMKKRANKHANTIQIAKQIGVASRQAAGHIASTLVARAEKVSKSGDKPFRNLLDLFIEDLCTVLGSPEWPAASLFLESLLILMLNIIRNQKEKGVQAADMALATVGVMGVGIIDFTTRLRHLKRSLDVSQSEVASQLVPLADEALKRSINFKDVLAVNGPYRIVLESLSSYLGSQSSRANRDDQHLRSLSGYYVTSWANAFDEALGKEQAEAPRSSFFVDLGTHLQSVLADPNWLAKGCKFHNVTDVESRLAAGIITSQERFCQYLQPLISCLLRSTQNHQAKVKSRAMSCLTQLIEKDPQILDDKSFPALASLIGDSSPMVRENALTLISKCLEQNPSLEHHCLAGILNLMTDPAVGPKRKAIKLLKDIFKGSSAIEKKIRISTELLLPIGDDDKTIADLTRQTLEEIWVEPLRSSGNSHDNQSKFAREKQVSLLVATVQNVQARPAHLQAFETFFTALLSPTTKNAADSFKICKDLVADMVEGVISSDSDTTEKTQPRFLQTLSIFAKVDPRLFTADQVQLLKLYVKSLATTEDLAVFRPTVTIFRYVFPALSTLQEAYLAEVQDSLNKVTGKLALQAAQGNAMYKQTLLDIAHCSWTISPLVKGDPPRVKSGLEKLTSMICSVVTQLEPLSTIPKDRMEAAEKRILSYMILLGTFGKICDFDEHVELFKANLARLIQMSIAGKKASAEQLRRLTAWKGPSVAVLLLDLILPFTKQSWDITIRQQALCSIGEICQQKTKHFTRADIEKAFKLPFINGDDRLIGVVLTQFRDFLHTAERRSESGAEIAVGEGAVHGAERLETSFSASDNDHATTHIARTFLPNITSTALGKARDLANTATEILVSISRQGLLHPKECGAALVALSTSLFPEIALKASAEHRKIHLQHETMFEKEYVAAITQAFEYQRDILNSPHGMMESGTSFKPKMHFLFDALKQGSRKTLKKFITNLLNQLNFELDKLKIPDDTIPEAVLFARFCLENLALFDYARLDEVIHVIVSIESIVLKQTGPAVALAIETELPEQQTEQHPQPVSDSTIPDGPSQASGRPSVTAARLRQITSGSMILSMMWETRLFLLKVFNLQEKFTANDLKKPANKFHLINPKIIWDRSTGLMTALDTPEAMRKQCQDFTEIINVDREHAVADEDADGGEQLAKAAAGYETPEEMDDGVSAAPSSGKGRKRKSSAGLGGSTPKKARGRAAGSKKAKGISKTPDGSD
ncbi:uncharacterized protein EI97DRAFT_419824 [Westerdykella ornata]|uniref:Sister chromatid cohesion protein n=1 Tax=Westerdykella ornata TaxID=318751 RepID=A0A6A6JIR8_WESOR|nr:uncharacterized protein EI97DRAFT_419824 [Westerdykella ornata]KAF2275546.1 hypothetical protein EI97DRAFT_419824 [Westerdykella ornata]